MLALSSGLCLDILVDSWQDACEAGMALQQLDVIGVADFKGNIGNGLLVSHPLIPYVLAGSRRTRLLQMVGWI